MDTSSADRTSEVPAAPIKAPSPAKQKSKLRRRFRKFLFRVWLPIVALFTAYLVYSYRATGFDPGVLVSNNQIEVVADDEAIRFTPKNNPRNTSLIFLPGSLVEPTAYAPLAHRIAESGYPVHILKLPLRSAPLKSQRSDVIQRARSLMTFGSADQRWIVAGHSFGAVLACDIASNSPEHLAGLVIIGSSHPRDVDLSHSNLDITKITATRDGIASPDRVKANTSKLPPQTHFIEIEGGNHSQFGYHGFQFGDHRATISRQAQQDRTAKALLDALDRASRQWQGNRLWPKARR